MSGQSEIADLDRVGDEVERRPVFSPALPGRVLDVTERLGQLDAALEAGGVELDDDEGGGLILG